MPALQQMIDQANRRTAKGNQRRFAQKASDSQMLDSVTQTGRSFLDGYHVAVRNGLDVGNNLRAVIRELETAVSLAERRGR